MSLTFPAAYSSASKQGNIQENWIIQLGFFNGDAQGKGEGGWDAVLQADGTANLLTSDVNTSTTSFPVDDNTVFAVGDYLKIESEIVKVTGTATNGGQIVSVVRAQMGTSVEAHEDNDAVYWNNFIAISGADTTVDSVFYRGVVTKQPSIRTSIDLIKSTGKVSNISLDLVNFQYKGDDFSAELLSGTRTYLNKDIRVYIQLNNNSTLSNCLHIYTGRLHGIKHGDDKIRLSIKSYSPWDRVEFPDVYSDEKILAPISYGDFGGNDSYYSNATPNLWRPVPYTTTSANEEYVIGTDSCSSKNVARYVETTDSFAPYLLGSGTSTTRTNVETINVGSNSNYKYFHLPASDTQASSGADITESDMDNPYDGTTTSKGTVLFADVTITGNVDQTHHQTYTISNTVSDATITLKYKVPTFSTNNMTGESIKVSFNTAGGDSTVSTHTGTAASTQTITKVITSAITSIDLEIQFEGTRDPDVGAESMSLAVDVYELYASTIKAKDDGDEVYIDADGTIKNYESGIAINIHEAHRSILHGHLGLTDTPTNWSALDTERAGSPTAWTILYWQNKQATVKQLLNMLQYEGQFIYLYERAAGQYIFIADSPSSTTTVTQNDITNFSINEVNFDELETKHIIDYDLHPAKGGIYRSQATQTSSNRTDYNFATKENIINITLKSLAASISGGSNRNDDWATYRQALFGSIKLTVDFELINPSLFSIEVGDIIDFGTMPVDPGGGSWSGKNFITIKTSRSPGKLKITAREV